MTRDSFSTYPQNTNRRFRVLLFTSFALLMEGNAAANPEGGAVVSGSATIVKESPQKLTVKQQSNRTVINWRNFSIGEGEQTHFQQPPGGAALNRVTSRQVSRILGKLTATGKVFLVNPNGVVFGKNSRVDVSALVSSIHDVRNRDFMAGRLRFTIPGHADAKITNQGTISVKEGGLVALVAPSIENSGIIYARLGRVALAAGDAVTIDPYGDDLITFEVPEGIAAQLTDPDQNPTAALIDLSGNILANGGGVLITAENARSVVDNAVNMTGFVEARSLSTRGGKVILKGGSGNVNVDGTIDTSGLGAASGGEVRVTTDGSLTMTSKAQILAEGGADGGDGGFTALSALDGSKLAGRVSVKAGSGNGDSGWLYAGDNVAAAETMRNPNTEGAGRVGSGANTVYFEANKGQADDSVAFIARGNDASLHLTAADAVLAMATDSGTETVRMGLSGIETMPEAVGGDKQAGVINYYLGNDGKQWIEGAATYKQVHYKDVYEGVDLVYYGNRAGDLEFDLKVKPGADPSRIALDYTGAASIRKTGEGDLVIKADKGEIIQKAPLIYQETKDAKVIVPGDYRVDATGRVTIKTGQYDENKTLVIDPIIEFSTHLGGASDENDNARNGQIDMDASGNIYVTGRTTSNDFPIQSALDSTLGGASDAFVSKFDSSNNLIYSTYLGGSAIDEGFGIAADDAGNAYVTGTTASTDFPRVNAEQAAVGGGNDAFVSKLNAAGGALDYSTFLGGSGTEDGFSIAVDSSGNAYVTGTTQSADFPDQGASVEQPTIGGQRDAFIARYDTTGDVTFATFLGGSLDDEGFGIAVDGSGNAYVAGKTASADFPTQNAADTTRDGSTDGFIAKYSSSGSKVYSTFHGGSGDDSFQDVAVTSEGTSYLAGDTDSSDITTLNAAQPNFAGGGGDAIVAAYTNDGNLIYSSFNGGAGFENGSSIAVDNSGNAFLTGLTTSTDLPTVASTQPAFGGGSNDAFISGFDSSGARIYSSYLGGSSDEKGVGIAIGGSAMVVTGNTDSSDFPRLNVSQLFAGPTDAFVTRYDLSDLFLPTTLPEDQQAALDQQISLAGRAPVEIEESPLQPPAEPTETASVPQTSGAGGEEGSSVSDITEATVRTLRSESVEVASQIIQGSANFSLSEQRAVFRRLPLDQTLTILLESDDARTQNFAQTLREVAEGRGPSFAEFSASLRQSGIDEASARILTAIFLRSADVHRDTLFKIAAQELADNPGILETTPIELHGQIPLNDIEVVSTPVTTDVSGIIANIDEIKTVSIGNSPITVEPDGTFRTKLTSPAINTTVRLTLKDGSISERSLFSNLSRDNRLFKGGGRISRDVAGNLKAEGRIANPQTIRQVFVDGRPAVINTDGSIQTSIAASDAAFAVITVDRTSGIRERHKIAITSQPLISELTTGNGDDGKPFIQGKLSNPAEVAGILIDGQPFEIASDGTFSSPLPEGTLTPVPVIIVNLDGSRTEEVVAVDRDVELANVETFTTIDGQRVFKGLLKGIEGVAELRVSGRPVAISADGTFAVRTQQEEAAPDTFVTVSVVHEDGSIATRQIATNPDPLMAGIDRQALDDGSAVIRARIADSTNVIGVRVGDQPAEIRTDGTFTVSLTPDQASQEISITVVFLDGTAKTQRIAAEDKAVVSDLRPVTAPVIGKAVAGRISNPGDVSQILANGQRVVVDADGSFLFPVNEAAKETIDLAIVFFDGSRLDRRLAVREQSPFSTLETVTGVDGAAISRGKLANPEDIAEVRVGGRPIEIAADGSFSITPSETNITENDTIAITTIHADGSRSEQRIATRPRPVIANFRPVLPTDGTATTEEAATGATGAVVNPEDIAEFRIDGKSVELSEDGSFITQISDKPITPEERVSITVLFKDGTRIDRKLALGDTPVSSPLQTVVTADGAAIATGSVEITEGVAEVRVNGRTVEVADDGTFQIELAAEAAETVETAVAQSTAGPVSITIINVDGTQREEQVFIDPSPLLTAAETVVASDGTLQLVGNLEKLEDIATVLVGDKPVTVGEDGSIEVLLDPTVAQIERSVSLTIILEDGSSRIQQVSVGTEPAFESVLAVTKEDGGSRLEGRLERSDDISILRVGGRVVPVGEDGSFSSDVLSTQGSPTDNVSVTIIYADGSRVDQKVALRDGPQVAAQDLVVTEDGGTVAIFSLAKSEEVAGVRVDGRLVEVEEGGSFSLRLDGTQTLIDETVSVTIVYADGSRLEQQVAVAQEPPITVAEAVSLSATSHFVEGQLTDVERVARVLVDGKPLNINNDGSFRLDFTESGKAGGSVSLTVVYADGSRKVQRLGVTAETLFQGLDAFATTDGTVTTTGRIDDVEEVSQVIINGREVPLADDGSFELVGTSSGTSVDQTLPFVVTYKDGARVTGQMATRSDSIIRALDTVIDANGSSVVEGRLNPGADVASISFGGNPVSIAPEGTFRLTVSEAQVRTATQRTLKVVYADGQQQPKDMVVRVDGPLQSLDTYTTRDGSTAVESTLADPETIAQVFVDEKQVQLDDGGSFVFRRSAFDTIGNKKATIRIVYKDGSIAGRTVSMNTNIARPTMVITNAQQSVDGSAVAEGFIANVDQIASLEIGGRSVNVGADGRIVYRLQGYQGTPLTRIPVNVTYRNGLNAETWVTQRSNVGAVVPLPRQPRKVALVIGNGSYGNDISSLPTASADASLVGNILKTRFDFHPRQLSDPTKNEIMGAFQRLGRELGSNDQLAIYYAGQSYTEPRSGQSYWLPRDAKTNSARNWLSGDRVYRTLDAMGLKQALLMADSEFNVSEATQNLRVERTGTPVGVVSSATGRSVQAAPGDSHSAFTWQVAEELINIEDQTSPKDLFRIIGEGIRRRTPLPFVLDGSAQ